MDASTRRIPERAEAGTAAGFGAELAARLACPCCKSRLDRREQHLRCTSPSCAREYPVRGGVPILIHDENSLFSVADFEHSGPSRFYSEGVATDGTRPSVLRRTARRLGNLLVEFPLRLEYLKGREALADMTGKAGAKRVLVVGAGASGYAAPPGVELVYTDVTFGPNTRFICDAHDLPFADGTFDGVLAVAIFEHVADPYRCMAEIERVLAPRGRIYAATPFLQPVHMGRYDFTRFSYMGHRRLLRGFDALADGMALGPGSMLAWAIQYFLLSFSDNLAVRRVLRTLGMLAGAPFRFADKILQRREGAIDAAGGLYFYGVKRSEPLSDRELLAMYRGRDQVYAAGDDRAHF